MSIFSTPKQPSVTQAATQVDWRNVAAASAGQMMAARAAAGYGATVKTGGMGDTSTAALNKKTIVGQ